eukprot:COSAG06_NODE_22091_length_734_cov_1.245669_2_plen_84_part_00
MCLSACTAFWQPKFVYADMELLETLGKREFVEGIAEAIKMGCIRLSSLFDTIEAEPEKIMNLDPELISEVCGNRLSPHFLYQT